MEEQFAFLASPVASPEMTELRKQIYDSGMSRGVPVWVAECNRPDLRPQDGFSPFEIADVCMDAVRASRNFILVTDGSFGTTLTYAQASLASSYIEMELFQAAALEKPVQVYVIGSVEPGSQLGRLLELLRFAFPKDIHQRVGSHEEVLRHIERMLDGERRHLRLAPRLIRRSRALVGILASQRHKDWANRRLGNEVEFLNGLLDSGVSLPDPDRVTELLDDAEAHVGTQGKLARAWLAIRELMGASYIDASDPKDLRLWDRALSRWASYAAWYGMHAHLFLGHQAALGTLLEVRSKLEAQGSSVETGGHAASVDGALASCYYSLSKIAPAAQRASFLERSELYVNRGLATAPATQHAGLHAIRGSVRLRQGEKIEAIKDYEDSLGLLPHSEEAQGREGELLAELGWAEIHALRIPQGVEHLRQGVELMKERRDPGFVVRGQRKLAYGLALRGQLPTSFRELLEARDLAVKHQIEGQLDLPMRAAGRVEEIMAAIGINLRWKSCEKKVDRTED